MYFDRLLASELPFATEIVIAIWPLLFIVNHLIVRRSRAVDANQNCIVVEDRTALSRASQPKWMLVQVLYAAAVFTVSLYMGSAVFVFFGGGIDVCLICLLALNVQALLSASALRHTGAGEGTLKLSNAYAYRQLGSRLFGAAAACALLGILLAHLALFGGALLCASTATGYYRRANKAGRRSATDRH